MRSTPGPGPRDAAGADRVADGRRPRHHAGRAPRSSPTWSSASWGWRWSWSAASAGGARSCPRSRSSTSRCVRSPSGAARSSPSPARGRAPAARRGRPSRAAAGRGPAALGRASRAASSAASRWRSSPSPTGSRPAEPLVPDQPARRAWRCPAWRSATLAELAGFDAPALVLGIIAHGVVSVLVGLLYAVMLPMLPRRTCSGAAWSRRCCGRAWSGRSWRRSTRLLNARVDWPWFVVSQIAFGLAAGFVVARAQPIATMQTWPLAVRAGLHAQCDRERRARAMSALARGPRRRACCSRPSRSPAATACRASRSPATRVAAVAGRRLRRALRAALRRLPRRRRSSGRRAAAQRPALPRARAPRAAPPA